MEVKWAGSAYCCVQMLGQEEQGPASDWEPVIIRRYSPVHRLYHKKVGSTVCFSDLTLLPF